MYGYFMKYTLLLILALMYLLLTWRFQEGFKNAKTLYLYETTDWETIKTELKPILEDTDKDRYVVIYGKNQDSNLVKQHLQSVTDPQDVGVKIMIEASSAVFTDQNLKDDMLKTFNPKSGDLLLAYHVYTFKQGEADSVPIKVPSLFPSEAAPEDAEEPDDKKKKKKK
jgi:hypothetical protein